MAFIAKTVGAGNSPNTLADVKVVQTALNHHRRPPLRPLLVDGVAGPVTIAAIEQFQNQAALPATGRVEPYGDTVVRLWPAKYANPTKRGLRGKDSYGSGHYHAPRRGRLHDGVDYRSVAGQPVYAALAGRVERISRPYRSGIEHKRLSGLLIVASDGTSCQMWYLQPKPNIVGSLVRAGDVVGTALTLQNRHPPRRPPLAAAGAMIDHIHVRLSNRSGQSINPSTLVPLPGVP